MDLGIFSSITGAVTDIIGSGFSLAGLKRQNEAALDALNAQGDMQHQNFLDQIALINEEQESQMQSSESTVRIVVVLGVLVITGIVVFFVVRNYKK